MLEVDKIDSRLSFGRGSERHGSIPEIGSQTALQCENSFKTVCDVIPGMDPWELGLGSNDLQMYQLVQKNSVRGSTPTHRVKLKFGLMKSASERWGLSDEPCLCKIESEVRDFPNK